MKSKISIAFDNCKKEKRPALITYTVAGDKSCIKFIDLFLHLLAKFLFSG